MFFYHNKTVSADFNTSRIGSWDGNGSDSHGIGFGYQLLPYFNLNTNTNTDISKYDYKTDVLNLDFYSDIYSVDRPPLLLIGYLMKTAG